MSGLLPTGLYPAAGRRNLGAVYIDLPDSANCPATMATFRATAPGRPVSALRLWRGGAWCWCAVAGWGGSGPMAAQLTPIEESGDGPALLVHGGDHGLRLAEIAGPGAAAPAWDLGDPGQWGEPFLICRPDLQSMAPAV